MSRLVRSRFLGSDCASPVPGLLLCTLAVASLVFIEFYPGAMSPDSLSILRQARSGVLQDGHPPLLALVWALVDRVVPGPAPMLLLNLVLYYGGLFLIFRAAARDARRSAIACCAMVGLFPPLLGIIGAIWIDVTFAGLLLSALGVLMTAQMRPPGPARIVLFVCAMSLLGGAIAIRHNGAAAVWPLAILLFLVLLRPLPEHRGRPAALVLPFALATAFVGLSFVSAQWLSAQITDVKQHLWRVAAIYDIAGVSHLERRFLFASHLFEDASLDDIDKLYSPRSAAPLLLGRQVHPLPPAVEQVEARPFDPARFDSMRNGLLFGNWREVVLAHPGSFLSHRLGVFESLTTRTAWGLWAPVFGAIYDNDLGVPSRAEPSGRFFESLRVLAFDGYLFVPACYLVVSTLAIVPVLSFGLRRQSIRLLSASALYASGIAHMAGLFFFAASPDFRYSHWMIAATVVATAIVALELVAECRQRRWNRRRNQLAREELST